MYALTAQPTFGHVRLCKQMRMAAPGSRSGGTGRVSQGPDWADSAGQTSDLEVQHATLPHNRL